MSSMLPALVIWLTEIAAKGAERGQKHHAATPAAASTSTAAKAYTSRRHFPEDCSAMGTPVALTAPDCPLAGIAPEALTPVIGVTGPPAPGSAGVAVDEAALAIDAVRPHRLLHDAAK